MPHRLYMLTAGRITRSSLAATLLIIAVACSASPVEPEPAPGRFGLTSVDGSELPTVLVDETVETEQGPFHLKITIVAGHLELLGTDRYEHRIDYTVRIDDGPSVPDRWTDEGNVARSGESLRFESSLIQNVSFEGALTGPRIDVVQDLLYHLHGTGRMSIFEFEK